MHGGSTLLRVTGLFLLAVLLIGCGLRGEPAPTPAPPTRIMQARLDAGIPTPTLGPAAAGTRAPDVITVTHTIQSGETLGQIALQYNVSLETLVKVNNIVDPARISAGDVLSVPVPRPDPTRDPNGPTPTAGPPPGQVNGIPYASILLMSPEVAAHAREIYARGRQLGVNSRAFSKVGDSTIENPFFLARFDTGPYNLGDYAYLQPMLDHFAGSFARDSVSVRKGMHSWSMMDPTWSDKALCQPGEAPLPCEIRLNRPAVLLVRLGSNDAGVPESFRQSMQDIIDYSIEQGVIPVLGTKADRFEGDDTNNGIIRQLAASNRVPVWDFDAVANTMPGKGLDVDNVHLTTFYQHDYTLPEAFQSGHAMHNLTAMVVLDMIWQEIMQSAP